MEANLIAWQWVALRPSKVRECNLFIQRDDGVVLNFKIHKILMPIMEFE